MDERPSVDGRAPVDVIGDMVQRVLALAGTWLVWDGKIRIADDRIYTPHKAIRRVADHLIDHLAQLEAQLAGTSQIPDTWHGSYVTTAADLVPFYEQDLNEARNRLLRLDQLWRVRLEALSDEELDRADGSAYTPREMAFHVAESVFYAEAVGELRPI
jgi:hypothetical protein